MTCKTPPQYTVSQADSHWVIAFMAMASPCEVHVRCVKASEAEELASLAFAETTRIEQKFSRYRNDNIIHAISHSDGQTVALDDETSQLLRYAGECHQLSDGLFDVTSGILRRAWKFEGQEVSPDKRLIQSLLDLVGWQKVQLSDAGIKLLPGMEIDLGGIGKEYGVDRVAQLLFKSSGLPIMVNFGGDIRAMSSETVPIPWHVGIESPEQARNSIGLIGIGHGAVATSGLSYRHCFVNGHRLGHILDPRTGWPVDNPPKSVTVLGDFCMEAGLLTTMAMLQGSEAEPFLEAQGVKFHCVR